jgi:hypothetical protein
MWRHPQGYVGFRPHCDKQIITRISAFFKRGWLFLSGERRPGYWAVLPATVRYDKTLRPNAKLLYAEITALADARGYCWATNSYLGELFEIAPRTIRDLLKNLADRGYIEVEVVRDEQTNEVQERRLWVERPSLPEEDTPPAEICHTPPADFCRTPPAENGHKINTSIDHTPYSPPEGDSAGGVEDPPKKVRRRRTAPKQAPDWKPERFARFWDYYPRGESKQAAIRAWDRLRPSDELIDEMARALERQVNSESWREGIGIPYASTWLNQQRWTDVPKQPPGVASAPDAPIRGEGVRYQ